MWTEKKLVDLSRLRLRNYASVFLEKNPFPSIGIPEDNPPLTVDRDTIVLHFQDVIAHLYQDGSSTVTVIVGDYGSGKSHLLKVFKHSVNSQLLQLDAPTLAIYVKSPGRNFLDLLYTAVDDIGKSVLSDYSDKVLSDFIKQSSKKSRYIFDTKMEEQFSKNDIRVGSLLRSSRFLELFSDIRKERFSNIKHRDLISAFLSLSHPDYSSIAWQWFQGRSLNKEEKNSIGVDESLDNSKEAYGLSQSFIELLHLVGITSIIILVDELEKTFLIPSLARSQFQDDLRHLIDDNPKNMALFFAIAIPQWEQLSGEPTALQRRLAGNNYILDKFDKERVRRLIEAYLEIDRTKEFNEKIAKNRFPHCSPSLSPFDDESVEAILSVTNGKVSDLIGLCRKALDYLIDHPNDFTEINKGLVMSLAKKEGL